MKKIVKGINAALEANRTHRVSPEGPYAHFEIGELAKSAESETRQWHNHFVFGNWEVFQEPRVIWVAEYYTRDLDGHCFATKEAAEKDQGLGSKNRLVKFVEVIE